MVQRYLFEMISSPTSPSSSSSPSSSPLPSSSSSPSSRSPSTIGDAAGLSDIVELFEDVEGIVIEPYLEWKFGQFFITNDELILPILAAEKIAVGNKFYPIKECLKIHVQSKGGEDLDPQVVLRVLFRSCEMALLSCSDENSSMLKFYCPKEAITQLCQVEHRVKGKDVIIQPESLKALSPTVAPPSKLISPQKNDPPPTLVQKSSEMIVKVNTPSLSPSSTNVVGRSFFPIQEPPLVDDEPYFVSILHDGQNCPVNHTITPLILYEAILNLVWKTLTLQSEPIHRSDPRINLKWNFILSPNRIHREMPQFRSTFYKDLMALGAALIDPGVKPLGIQKSFMDILSDLRATYSTKPSNSNHNQVVILICHADQDYVDIVRQIRNAGAKVMLIYSDVSWNDEMKQFQPLPSGSKFGLRVILPRHYVLGVWEDILSTACAQNNLSLSTVESQRKRTLEQNPLPLVSSAKKLRGIDENYGSKNCKWCFEYYGENCILHGASGHSSNECWYCPKKKNTEDHCAWCWKYLGKKFRHKTIKCWNLECPWCRKHNDERCFHHIEKCPKIRQSVRDKGKNPSPSPKCIDPDPSRKPNASNPPHYRDNISAIDEIWKDDIVKSDNAIAAWVEDRIGNRKNQSIDVSHPLQCSWCAKYLGMNVAHPSSECPSAKHSPKKQGCLWCLVHLGVKLEHDILTCPNKLEKETSERQTGRVQHESTDVQDKESKVKIENQKASVPLDPRLRNKMEKAIKETVVMERDPNCCERCWSLKKEQLYHGHDECEFAPRPKGNTKPISPTPFGGSDPIEEEGEEPEDMQWGDEDHCARCWDNIRMRRYHSISDCPYAPKPKGNQKPSFNEEISPVIADILHPTPSSSSHPFPPSAQPIDLPPQTLLSSHVPTPPQVALSPRVPVVALSEAAPLPTVSSPSVAQPTSLRPHVATSSSALPSSLPLVQVKIEKMSPSDRVVIKSEPMEDKPKKGNNSFEMERDICQLCWEHYRQRRYHDHPHDCRAAQKMRKNQKKWN
jgi:hypothetical protein